ncbi:death-associated protein kinase 3-like [Tubulanus polymorphus]|uniref:death-associated protein kinase 3-like n=1 Tax=Tubulanus polymorphus TaxID=672921 RepID=UPI003DA35356
MTELEFRTENFEDFYELTDDVLGNGRFSVVWRCAEIATGREYAAKIIKKKRYKSSSRRGALSIDDIKREAAILNDLAHENVISIHDAFENGNQVVLVLELVTGGELFEYLSEKDHLTEAEAVAFLKQILTGVKHMHEKNIAHLDLKPENIMLMNHGSNVLKLIDFGLSKRMAPNEELREMMGTPEFVAPEVINFEPLSVNTDMWSIGVIAYLLVSGRLPFHAENKQATYAKISANDYRFAEDEFASVSERAKDFIARLLVKDPRRRMDVRACFEHPWMKAADDDVTGRKQELLIKLEAMDIKSLRTYVTNKRINLAYRS